MAAQGKTRGAAAYTDDHSQAGFRQTIKTDLRDIYHFYLDKASRARLASMGRIKRGFFLIIWLIKSLFLKLSVIRRVFLLISFYLFFAAIISVNVHDVESLVNLKSLGYFLLLFILALELKDKLLAKNELAIGRQVQFALMPDTSPELPGWEIWLFTRPANEVGGDLVDSIALEGKRIGLILGDVAGKGLGAALFMAKLQATWRALITDIKSLSDLGKRMNTIFCRDGLPSRFVSMITLELTANSGRVRSINAGHLPPLILNGSRVYEMEAGSPALGLIKETEYNEKSLSLQRGEIMLVYSDGLTEACNEDGHFYSRERLQNLLIKCRGLSAEEAGQRIIDDVNTFLGQARPNDDLSIIILKRIEI